MVEALKNSITHNFDDVSFNLVDWGEVLDKSSDVSVFHLKSTVDYYSSYFEGVNLSFILYENKMPIGIFPLFVHKKENNWFLSCDGNNLIKPLFINNIAKKAKKREKQILEIIYYIARFIS